MPLDRFMPIQRYFYTNPNSKSRRYLRWQVLSFFIPINWLCIDEWRNSMQERLYPRLRTNYETTIITKDGIFTGVLENVSLGGFFLRTNKRMEVGAKIEVDIPLRENSRNINIVGNVIAVRVEENGIAFKFDDTEQNNFWSLHAYLNNCTNA
jgi:Tfp pilus assembly protein PilZ